MIRFLFCVFLISLLLYHFSTASKNQADPAFLGQFFTDFRISDGTRFCILMLSGGRNDDIKLQSHDWATKLTTIIHLVITFRQKSCQFSHSSLNKHCSTKQAIIKWQGIVVCGRELNWSQVFVVICSIG